MLGHFLGRFLHHTCDNQIRRVIWVLFLAKRWFLEISTRDGGAPYHQASIDLYRLEVGSRDWIFVNVFKLRQREIFLKG